MDAVSYSLASKQAQRIEKFIENPDSTSGIVTVPKVIASGETITIPAGRVAVLPNVQVDGVLNIEGEVFVPSGATTEDLDAKIAFKADTTYVNTQLGLKQNVLVANDTAVKTALNATGAAPIYACRAWVNFNGTGTVAIRASGNVSSITDNGIGDYMVNFSNAMVDANYSTFVSSKGVLAGSYGFSSWLYNSSQTVSNVRVSYGDLNSLEDAETYNVSIFR